MSTALIFDIAIAGVFLLCLFVGRSRGLFRSLMSLVIIVVAAIFSAKAADVATDYVVKEYLRPSTVAAIEQRVDELALTGAALSPAEDLARVMEAIPNDYVREKAAQLLASLGLSTDAEDGFLARDALVEAGTDIADQVLDSAVRDLLRAILQVAAFLLLTVLLRWLISLLDLTFRLPLLRQLNQFGGMLFGALQGGLVVALGVWILHLSGWLINDEVLAKSYLLPLVYRMLGL